MSHTNSTTNYNLPQFLTTDKPAWLTDVNNAYLAIDTAMKNNADAASTADTKATNADTAATNADTKATVAKSVADGAVASLGTAFSDSATYNKDDIVIYNSLLYRCTIAILTPGAWTGSANWERITVGDELESLEALNKYSATEQAIGTWLDGSTLYRKCITNHTLTSAVEAIDLGVKIDKLVSLDINLTLGSGIISVPVPYRHEDGGNYYEVYDIINRQTGGANTLLTIITASSTASYYDGSTIDATILYTKA